MTVLETQLSAGNFLDAAIDIGKVLIAVGEVRIAEGIYRTVLARATAPALRPRTAEAHLRLGVIHAVQADWDTSTSCLLRSRRLFLSLKQDLSVAQVDLLLGTNSAEQGDLQRAQKQLQRAFMVFERAGHQEMIIASSINLGIVANMAGEYDNARAHYDRARLLLEQGGDVHRLTQVYMNIAMTHVSMKEYRKALRAFGHAGGLATKHRFTPVKGLACLGKAHVYSALRELPAALRMVNLALEYFSRCNDRLSQADAYKVKGMILRDLGKYRMAETYLKTSLRLNQDLQNQSESCRDVS